LNNAAYESLRGVIKSKEQSNHQRTKSQGVVQNKIDGSRYRNIPTDNIKFQQFIELIFDSKMSKEDVKYEILSYIQTLETNYTETIKDVKMRNERLKGHIKKEKSKNVN